LKKGGGGGLGVKGGGERSGRGGESDVGGSRLCVCEVPMVGGTDRKLGVKKRGNPIRKGISSGAVVGTGKGGGGGGAEGDAVKSTMLCYTAKYAWINVKKTRGNVGPRAKNDRKKREAKGPEDHETTTLGDPEKKKRRTS